LFPLQKTPPAPKRTDEAATPVRGAERNYARQLLAKRINRFFGSFRRNGEADERMPDEVSTYSNLIVV
jgi:hypothetical protein